MGLKEPELWNFLTVSYKFLSEITVPCCPSNVALVPVDDFPRHFPLAGPHHESESYIETQLPKKFAPPTHVTRVMAWPLVPLCPSLKGNHVRAL